MDELSCCHTGTMCVDVSVLILIKDAYVIPMDGLNASILRFTWVSLYILHRASLLLLCNDMETRDVRVGS